MEGYYLSYQKFKCLNRGFMLHLCISTVVQAFLHRHLLYQNSSQTPLLLVAVRWCRISRSTGDILVIASDSNKYMYEEGEEHQQGHWSIILPVEYSTRGPAGNTNLKIETMHGIPQANEKALHCTRSLSQNELQSWQEDQHFSKAIQSLRDQGPVQTGQRFTIRIGMKADVRRKKAVIYGIWSNKLLSYW